MALLKKLVLSDEARSRIFREGEGVTLVATCPCDQGTIKLQMTSDIPGSVGFASIDFTALQLVTSKVKIDILFADNDQDKLTITLPAAEAVELIGGTRPCTATFDRIRRQVCDLKRYPLPKPEIPGGGEKSLTAQGQTKKPGSHSHDKHK